MKHKLFKIWLLLVLLSLANMPCSIFAQSNTQYEITGVSSKGSIIVAYKNNVEIVYNNGNTKAFFYVDRNTLTSSEAMVSNLDEVSDMEIVGDTVFFCGVMNGNQGVGFFKISDLFFSTAHIEFIPIPVSPVINGCTGTLTMRKLEIYAPGVNDVHIFALGDISFGCGPNGPADFTCLFNLYYDGTQWQIEYVYDINGDYLFDDIAVLTTRLMVIGHKNTGGDYSHEGALLTPMAFNILNPTILPPPCVGPVFIYSTDAINYFNISQQMIETLGIDEYATLSYGLFNQTPGVVYTHYSAPGILVYRWMVPNVTTTTEFRDLRWNSVSDQLFLAPNHNNTVIKNQIYESHLGFLPGTLKPNKMDIIHSLDCKITGDGVIVSGTTNNNYLGVWDAVPLTDGCANNNALPIDGDVHDVYNWPMLLYKETVRTTPVSYKAVVTDYALKIICE